MTQEFHAGNDGSAALRLATFVEKLPLVDIPSEVVESAKLRLLDILGICVAAREERGPRAARAVASSWGSADEAETIGWGDRVSASAAALVNGTLAHSLDFDDTHHEVRIHPSTVVIPTALAVAQKTKAGGKEFLEAAIAGFEALIRIGMVAPARFHERGLHATSLCGAPAAAAIAARLLGLDAVGIAHAIGVAGSQASGLREAYLGDATDTKALHAGWASHAGVVAAQLAAEGFTGPRDVFEGRFGFYNAFVAPDPWDIDRLTDDLGEVWETPKIVYKLFPCGSLIHGCIDAALETREKPGFSVDEIEEVVCVVAPGMVSTVCEPEEQKLNPQSGYQAKFSLQYAVAAALIDGNVTRASYSEERVADPKLRALLQRVRYETNPSLPFPKKYPGEVQITLSGGRRIEASTPNSPGSPDKPATAGDLIRKFEGNVGDSLGDDRQEVIDRVMNLENGTSIDEILELCRSGSHTAQGS